MVDIIDFELTQRSNTEVKIECQLEAANPSDTDKLISGQRVKILAIPEEDPRSKSSSKIDTNLTVLNYELLSDKKEVREFETEKREETLRKFREIDQPFEAFAESLAPNLGDMELAKKCIAASLIGAPEDETGAEKDYGRIHIAILSNPGMGKSQLQSWVRSTFSNVHLATGGSGTGTALTGTAENVNGEWRVVAGKVVFADRGFLQVDEFDKFSEGELTKLNTAMEDGFFPIDKASVSTELPGRATIIATGNFNEKLDKKTKPIDVLPKKGQGLYDRFALMCALTDQEGEAADKILQIEDQEHSKYTDEHFSPDQLRIIRYEARNLDPDISKEAKYHLKKYFQASKDNSEGDLQGKSNRLLVHLKKLTLCIARANLRDLATFDDAQKATKLMREARNSLGLDLGQKPDLSSEKKQRIQDFSKAYDMVSNGKEADLETVKQVYTDKMNHDLSVFQDVWNKTKKEGEFYEPETGKIAKL
jgi:DNA replicative helicase MCM subunit Mcm2 (Cdc46/Mcm family)